MTNTQVNLEQTVQKSMLKRIGEGLKNKLGGAKRYATIVVATAGLALGGTYIGGCDTETTECCAQLDCDQYSKSGDRYNCGTTTIQSTKTNYVLH